MPPTQVTHDSPSSYLTSYQDTIRALCKNPTCSLRSAQEFAASGAPQSVALRLCQDNALQQLTDPKFGNQAIVDCATPIFYQTTYCITVCADLSFLSCGSF